MNQDLAELLSSMVHRYLRVDAGGSRAAQLMNGFDPDVKLKLNIAADSSPGKYPRSTFKILPE